MTSPRRPRNAQLLSAEEAHRRLPLVRAIVSDITCLHADLTDRRDRLRSLPRRTRSDGGMYAEERQQVRDEIATDERTLRGFVSELEAIGCQLRDAQAGRVEFRGRLEGEQVYFGWVQGEDELSYWRGVSAPEDERHSLLQNSATAVDDETE